jgi:ribosomal protein L35AE/L33A
VALARNKPEEALKIFDNALVNIPGMSRFKETTLGKLQALVALDKLEEAEKLAQEIVTDKTFRGETAAKAYLLQGRIYRLQAAKAVKINAAVGKDLYAKAHGTYIRVFVAYRSVPDVCAEAIFEAAETAGEMGDEALRQQNLRDLLGEPKLENTPAFKKAREMVK